ncbi:MAG: class I SAM-dependent methyltransferase, partial [Bacteroidia bacterium]|nr:class I SAM-dependent methyltransferase [Bacteroidia bacterium]
MNSNKVLWEKGDFTQIAATMRESGEALINKIGITKGMKVLDLGSGDGTTAIPAARKGAKVLGIDIASNLVQAGNDRAREEKLSNLKFEEGDAADLVDIDNNSFDVVLSIFGAMFASNPVNVAKEMVRVTRPGGKIIMGNWIPGDPTLVAQVLQTSSMYTPAPPDGFVSPMLWGMEDQVIERFGKAGIRKECIFFEKDTFTFNAAFSPEVFLEKFKNFYGPTMNAFEAARKNGKEKNLQADLEALFKYHNQSGNESSCSIPATYL